MKNKDIHFFTAALFLVIGVAGFLDSSYLAYEHITNKVPPCTILHGCEKVTTSQYATVGPIPIALFGSLYYLIFIAASSIFLLTAQKSLLKTVAIFSTVGFLVSSYLVYLQLIVIGAICIYCMFSVATSTFLFLAGMHYLFKSRTA